MSEIIKPTNIHKIPEKRVPLITAYTGPVGDERIRAIAESKKRQEAKLDTLDQVIFIGPRRPEPSDGISLINVHTLQPIGREIPGLDY